MKQEVLNKYDLKGVAPVKLQVNGWGTIDFPNLTVKEADDLVKAGFPYLVKKVKEPKDETKISAK